MKKELAKAAKKIKQKKKDAEQELKSIDKGAKATAKKMLKKGASAVKKK